jgi:L-ascorbate metabolism protein UlaG (beta-lactamase superfamily)
VTLVHAGSNTELVRSILRIRQENFAPEESTDFWFVHRLFIIETELMASDHFNGRRFFTPGAPGPRPFADVVRWMMNRHPEPWTQEPDAPFLVPPLQVNDGLRVTFVNHSTVLIQTAGMNILTDPIWSERASPFSFAGPKRFAPPGFPLDKLPPLHVILISHNHYDHLDLRTLRAIGKDHSPAFIAALGNAKYLRTANVKQMKELDWWDSQAIGHGVTVHCTPAQHFSGRGIFDRDHALWCSYVIDSPAGRIYFGADTGFGAHFQATKDRFGDFRLALLPIGAYEPRWFMSPVHVSPEEAIEAHKVLSPEHSIAIHHGTFALADEPQFQARDRIRQLAAEQGLPFHVLKNGEYFTL